MEHEEWNLVDKTSWGPGPWQDEPDRMEWADEETGIACLVVRNVEGAFCGYVGVSKGHPWYGVHFYDVDAGPDVHRELTYSNECPAADDPETLWWLGFHCSHARDLSPALLAIEKGKDPLLAYRLARIREHQTYMPIAYVQAQCAVLAHSALLALEAKEQCR